MAFITNLTNAIGYTGIYVNGSPSGVDNDQGNVKGGGTVSESDKFSSSSVAGSTGIQTTAPERQRLQCSTQEPLIKLHNTKTSLRSQQLLRVFLIIRSSLLDLKMAIEWTLTRRQ